jgi:hypothetical protein
VNFKGGDRSCVQAVADIKGKICHDPPSYLLLMDSILMGGNAWNNEEEAGYILTLFRREPDAIEALLMLACSGAISVEGEFFHGSPTGGLGDAIFHYVLNVCSKF